MREPLPLYRRNLSEVSDEALREELARRRVEARQLKQAKAALKKPVPRKKPRGR